MRTPQSTVRVAIPFGGAAELPVPGITTLFVPLVPIVAVSGTPAFLNSPGVSAMLSLISGGSDLTVTQASWSASNNSFVLAMRSDRAVVLNAQVVLVVNNTQVTGHALH